MLITKSRSLKEAKEFVRREYDSLRSDPRWYMPEYWIRRFGLSIDLNALLALVDYEDYIYDDLKLLESNLKIVIVTNNPRIILEKKISILKEMNLSIHSTFSSVSDWGITKSKEFYQNVCKKLSVKPSEVLHLGDEIVYDLLMPRAIGMRSILIDRKKRLSSYDVIHSLDTLKEYIG